MFLFINSQTDSGVLEKMYSVVFALLIVFSNADSVRECSYVSCITDFLQTLFSSGDPVYKANDTDNVKEIKIGELQNIFSDLTHLIERQTPKKSDGVLKDYGKTQVFVKYVTFDNSDSVPNKPDFKGETNKTTDSGTVISGNTPNIDISDLNDKNVKLKAKNYTSIKSASDYINSTKKEPELHKEKTHEKQNKTKEILEIIELNSETFEKSLGNLRTNDIYEDMDIIYFDDNSTDYPIIDYIDIYKDTTNEENLYIPTEPAISNEIIITDEFVEVKDFQNETIVALTESNLEDENLAKIVSWIVAIFVKNNHRNSQFDYYCDGALLSNKTILTAARCVNLDNSTVKPEDVLVVVGKKALSGTGANEKTYRITNIIPHENFTNADPVENDLAILVMEEQAVYNNDVNPANISHEMDFDANVDISITTAWAYSGYLGFVFFEKVENKTCRNHDFVENTICGTFGIDVPLCPSYGGMFVVKQQDQWYLQGIMYGDPAERGLCFSKDVTYTSLKQYLDWIDEIVNKNI